MKKAHQMTIWIILITSFFITFSGCEWFEGDDPNPTCHIWVDFENAGDSLYPCAYLVRFFVIPCKDDVLLYVFEYKDFTSDPIWAENGEAEFFHTFPFPYFYEIEVRAIDKNGDVIAHYSRGHEITCEDEGF